jgi:hypothetical protein
MVLEVRQLAPPGLPFLSFPFLPRLEPSLSGDVWLRIVYIASRKLSQLQSVATELNTLAGSGPGATARGGAGGGGQGVCIPLVADLKDKAGVDDLINKFREKGEIKLDVLIK